VRLYGTTTSPFVRRVRIIAREAGIEHGMIDTSTDAGQQELRSRSPIWKIPAIELDGTMVFDSHVIIDVLLLRHPCAFERVPPEDIATRNRMTVVDGALDSLINCLYLGRDGIGGAQSPYLAKQRLRARASLQWLEANWPRVDEGHPSLPGLWLTTAKAWMQFRHMAEFGEFPRLSAVCDALEARESFVATRPA
jgi:glutathione S-transferase